MPAPSTFASHFEFNSDNTAVIITLVGRLDPEAVDEIYPQIQDVYRAGVRRFVFDLSKLEHAGSLGLRLMLGLRNQVKGEGQVALCTLSEPVRSLFRMMRLHEVLREYPSRAEALEATAV